MLLDDCGVLGYMRALLNTLRTPSAWVSALPKNSGLIFKKCVTPSFHRWCHLVRRFIRQRQPQSWQSFQRIPDAVALLSLAALVARGRVLSGNWAPKTERRARGWKSFSTNGFPVSRSKQRSCCPNNNSIISDLQPPHSRQETLRSYRHIHQ